MRGVEDAGRTVPAPPTFSRVGQTPTHPLTHPTRTRLGYRVGVTHCHPLVGWVVLSPTHPSKSGTHPPNGCGWPLGWKALHTWHAHAAVARHRRGGRWVPISLAGGFLAAFVCANGISAIHRNRSLCRIPVVCSRPLSISVPTFVSSFDVIDPPHTAAAACTHLTQGRETWTRQCTFQGAKEMNTHNRVP